MKHLIDKLRLGVLPQEIETGRCQKIGQRKLLPEERICKLCSSGKYEDEFHFLFHCPALEEVRKKYYDKQNKVDRRHFVYTMGASSTAQVMKRRLDIYNAKCMSLGHMVRELWRKRADLYKLC